MKPKHRMNYSMQSSYEVVSTSDVAKFMRVDRLQLQLGNAGQELFGKQNAEVHNSEHSWLDDLIAKENWDSGDLAASLPFSCNAV